MKRRDSLSYTSDEEYCYSCCTPGHFKVDCYAVTHLNGHPLGPCQWKRGGGIWRITQHGNSHTGCSQAEVYVLKDSTGKMYVGKSTDTKRRVDEHKGGKGTTFLGEGIKQAASLAKGSTDDLES